MSQIFESENRNLILFFLITFSWSWLFWLLPFLSPTGILTNNVALNILLAVLSNIGVFGPFVGAFSLTYLNEKMEGVKKLWKKFWNIKIEVKWLLIIILLFPILNIVPFFIAVISGVYKPSDIYFSQPWFFIISLLLSFAIIFFIGGPFGEEFGWRGYVLPRFQAKWNAFVSSIVLGVIWSFWHLPMFFIPGTSQYGQSFLLYVLWVILISILFTWIFNNTEGNILGVLIFHALVNTMGSFFSVPNLIFTVICNGGFLLITTVLVVVIFGPKKLVREAK